MWTSYEYQPFPVFMARSGEGEGEGGEKAFPEGEGGRALIGHGAKWEGGGGGRGSGLVLLIGGPELKFEN